MAKPFAIADYVDLSAVSDPRLLAEITRTLEYFAKFKQGRALLEEASKAQGGPIHITAEKTETAHFVSGDESNPKHININTNFIQQMNYFTTPDLDPKKTAPFTLPHMLWHELEHARREEVVTPESERIWSQEADSKNALQDVQMEDIHAARNAGNPVATSRLQTFDWEGYVQSRHQAELRGQSYPMPEGFSGRMDQAIEKAYRDEMAAGNIDSQLNEAPVIASTNAAMKKLFPKMPARYSHEGFIDSHLDNPVNSGTLSPKKQAQEDAKYLPSPVAGNAQDDFLKQRDALALSMPRLDYAHVSAPSETPPIIADMREKPVARNI